MRRAAACKPLAQSGAALLAALLSVALIASLASTALWQQWRLTEVESSARARMQSLWILSGALDWGRLILREDARQGGADHLGEPWAVPLKDARLSSFLAADKTIRSDTVMLDAFLAGRIEDLQGRLNVRNLIEDGKVSPADLLMFERLFELLDLPTQELARLAQGLRAAMQVQNQAVTGNAPLMPHRVDHMVWLGLSPASLQRLHPFITWLPVRTGVNLNTASAEVLSASTPALALAQARQLVEERRRKPWQSIDEANRDMGGQPVFKDQTHTLASRYFLVSGQMRQDSHLLQAQALVRRDGLNMRVLWRDVKALPPEQLGTTLR